MNGKNEDERENDRPAPLQRSLGMGDALRLEREREGTRRRVVRRAVGGELTEQQEQLLTRLIVGASDEFGPKERKKQRTLRFGRDLDARLDAFLSDNPKIEFTRFMEVAADMLLSELQR